MDSWVSSRKDFHAVCLRLCSLLLLWFKISWKVEALWLSFNLSLDFTDLYSLHISMKVSYKREKRKQKIMVLPIGNRGKFYSGLRTFLYQRPKVVCIKLEFI